jgi:NAD+ synthase
VTTVEESHILEIDVPDWMHEKLKIDTNVAKLVLTRFVRSEVTKAGFGRAVVGLSGGIDSALSCHLAAHALGPGNVMALRMPYTTSSNDSLIHSQLIVDNLGVHCETIDITEAADALFAASPEIGANRKGNIMARLRMVLLYDRSAAWKGLVVGTSNKTEMLLGYGTIYGDLASAVNPIGDLYKTQVRQLAEAVGVPELVIKKAPTADLIPGQTDEADLGFTYGAVDPLLYLLVDERFSADAVVELGFPRRFVRTVIRMIRMSQYKRALPVIPKLSARTIDHDFRYLRDWGT